MTDAIPIRAGEPRDREALIALLADCFEGLSVERERERQAWAFERNPARDPSVPTAWVAELDGRLVGTYGLLPLRFLVDGVPRPALAGVDFCVRPELRGRGLGRRLSDAFLATPGSDLRVITSPTAATVALMRERGACVIESRAERALLGRPGPFEPVPADDALELRSLQTFGPEFDDLARALGRHHRWLVLRDAAYLNWRYVEDPFLRHVPLAAYAAGRLLGLCVLTLAQSDAQGFVAELVVSPDDTAAARALVAAALRAADEHQLSAVVAYERRPALRALYASLGFQPLDEPLPDATLLSLSGPVRAADWFLGPGDGDVLFRIGGN